MPERATRERDLLRVIPKPLRFELTRARLLTRLEGAKLVALIAPSGFGKTTLLAQYARSLGSRAIWLELREDDADTTSLARDIRSGIERTQGDLQIADPELEQYRPEALARALDDAPENLTLILDRLDRVGPDAGRWLERFVNALAEGHRVIVAGYDADALSLARLVAEGSAVVIGPDELAFDPEETEQNLRDRGHAGDASTVQAALEGWPAGVALVAAGASAQLAPADLIADALSKLPTDVRGSLPEASVLEVWSEDAAARLGCQLPAGWISAVRRAGLPLTPLGKQTYRPLQVLLELLETELRRDPLRHAALHRTAGIAAETTGDTLRAIQHYRTANLDDEAVRLAERVTPQLFAQAEYRLICRTLERLPLEQLSPGLQETFGFALTETGATARGEVLLRRLRAAGSLTVTGLWTLGKLALGNGEPEATLRLADEGLGQVEANTRDAERLLRLRGHALSHLGRHTEALEAALEAARIAESLDDLRELGQAILLAQAQHRALGQWDANERLIRRGIEIFEALELPVRALELYNDLANLQCLCDHIEDARVTLAHAMPLGEREENTVLSLLLETRADTYLWCGEFARAAEDYGLAVQQEEHFKLTWMARYRPKLVEAAWRAGDTDRARAELARARATTPASTDWLHGRIAFAEGLIALESAHLESAAERFELALARTDDPTQGPRAAAFLAEIARRAGRLEHIHLERVLEQLNTVPSDAVLRADAPILAGLWRECSARGWFTERFAPLASAEPMPAELDGQHPSPAITPSQPKEPPAHLEIAALGQLRVSLGGNVVRLPFAKAGELLVWLAIHGPSNHQQVIDALWDGSIEEKHHEYFRVAVRRLRASLKSGGQTELEWNPLPFEGGVYALSRKFEITLDARLNERALETSDPSDLRAAIDAYRGEFLPGVDTEWVTRTRTRCLENTVTVALTLGALLERTEPREALGAYRRAVELEPLSELGHLGLIRAHLALGGLAAANQAYSAYARMLSEEFGLEPSPDLRRSLTELGLRI